MKAGDIYKFNLTEDIEEIEKKIRPVMLLEVGEETSFAVFMTHKTGEGSVDLSRSYGFVECEDSEYEECFYTDKPIRVSNDDLMEYIGRFAGNISALNEIIEKVQKNSVINLNSVADIENDDELSIKSDIESVYPLWDIKVEKGFYTVFELKRKFDSADKRIILDSDFQRENVWNIRQNSELVESVLMGLPLPIFYFNQDKYGRIIVVDGRQRLTALFKYLNGEFALKELRVLSNLKGKKFSELSPLYQTKLEDYQISAHVIMPPTPERIKYDIFDRVNRGGTMLNKQEIRNALYQGPATRLLNEIVEMEAFSLATGGAFRRDKRMKNKYLITRFLAAYLYMCERLQNDEGDKYIYNGDLDDMLGRSLDMINSMTDEEISDIKNIVVGLLSRVYDIFGENAFRMPSSTDKKNPINMNLFEFIMVAMFNCDVNESRDSFISRVNDIITSNEFIDNIGNHRDGAVKYEWRMKVAALTGKGLGR
ncbi:DUF262 domain-containing protein [Butyrivibrio fibrisolvens]|uniref:DUF262 domain-containing protein n=1 Tax=Butyrivibrio fibrisolvens TaxID=831 RepID=UPI00041B7A0E|nr:DUF262 domain-containing protein [Butyrivibrio fibrisolvens]